MNKYKVLYKDGTEEEVESDETKQRLEQHAHIARVELVDDLVEVASVVEPVEIIEQPVVEEITEVKSK